MITKVVRKNNWIDIVNYFVIITILFLQMFLTTFPSGRDNIQGNVEIEILGLILASIIFFVPLPQVIFRGQNLKSIFFSILMAFVCLVKIFNGFQIESQIFLLLVPVVFILFHQSSSFLIAFVGAINAVIRDLVSVIDEVGKKKAA